jgi:hypothetical protein
MLITKIHFNHHNINIDLVHQKRVYEYLNLPKIKFELKNFIEKNEENFIFFNKIFWIEREI